MEQARKSKRSSNIEQARDNNVEQGTTRRASMLNKDQ
jgi:hypothetical protein